MEEVAEAVGGGYCRLRMPLRLAPAVRETVAGHRLGALEGGGGYLPPFQYIPALPQIRSPPPPPPQVNLADHQGLVPLHNSFGVALICLGITEVHCLNFVLGSMLRVNDACHCIMHTSTNDVLQMIQTRPPSDCIRMCFAIESKKYSSFHVTTDTVDRILFFSNIRL